ncbi:hypothetical protein [Mycobacterium sp.]|uniref:hypothetical protein n=1 Tax=Mycobacterium sp. TaxID=1785 RepID=UPI002D97541F|nr:hypothetical protein [Mycobacterium sp.]
MFLGKGERRFGGFFGDEGESLASPSSSAAPAAAAHIPRMHATPGQPPRIEGAPDRQLPSAVTVTVDFWLADSFDILADGRCAGRSTNEGMRDGTRALLRGTSPGFDVEANVVALMSSPRRGCTGEAADE